jgi:hypothetical protein
VLGRQRRAGRARAPTGLAAHEGRGCQRAMPDAVENKRRFREAQQRIRDSQRESLATVQFQIFTDQGWPATMSGSGTSDDVVNSVTARHGTRADQPGPTLRIETAQNDRHGDSEYAHARAELDHWLHSKGSDVPTDRSDAGLTVAWRQHDRERRRLAATATRGKSSSAPTARSSHSVTSDPMTIGSPLGDPATGPSGS